MLNKLKNRIRRRLRGRQWQERYPILLPHVMVQGEDVRALGGSVIESRLPAEVLRRCDGMRRMNAVVHSPLEAERLVALNDAGHLVFWFREVAEVALDGAVKVIVLSPHPDDAALSVGGMLLKRAVGEVLIVNCFTRVGWWRLSAEASVDRVTVVRTAEEMLIARLLGARMEMLALPEAPLRAHALADVFTDDIDRRDAAVLEAIEQEVRGLAAAHPSAEWWLPLGVGHHLDHRVVRAAAERALADAVAPQHLKYYEDQPYAAEGAVVEPGGMKSHDEEVSNVIRWKMELNRVYWSQMTWGRIEGVARYARDTGCGRAVERLWTWAKLQE